MKRIFILHGWAVRGFADNKKMWQPFIDSLESNDLEVIFLRIPGLSAPLNEVWNLDNYVEWLEQEISDKSKNEKFILLGHSFGGQLATRYVSKNNQKIEKLILLDSAGIRDMSPRVVVKRAVFLFLSKLGKFIFRGEFFRKILYKLAREADYKNASPLLRKTMSQVLNDQILKDLPNVNCPTKIIWGENDLTTPVKNANKMQKEIKNSELVFIKDARHSPQFTHYQETAKLVVDFIAED